MKIHRFIGNFDFSGDSLEINGDLAHQMHSVLRLRVGELIHLGNGNMQEIVGKIDQIGKASVKVLIQERMQNTKEPERDVRLYCSLLKRENFELVVQKVTEIGVREITPIIVARTIKLSVNHKRLKKIIHEAAEQSGRGIVPVLHETMHFDEAIEAAKKDETNILFDVSGKIFENPTRDIKKINMFIGPEGGWTPQEIEIARDSGFEIASLGKLTLRGETAAIVGAYLLK